MENLKQVIMEKRPIRPTLRKMNVGDIEVFPRVQYSSIMAIKARLKIELDIVFQHEVKENGIVVKRTL